MEDIRNYVVYIDDSYGLSEMERVVAMTESQAKAIRWFMDMNDIRGCVEIADDYEAEVI
jgi:hypothetical protein